MPITARQLIHKLLRFNNLDEEVQMEYCAVDYIQRVSYGGDGFILLQTKQRLYTQEEMHKLCSKAYSDGVDHALAGLINNIGERT